MTLGTAGDALAARGVSVSLGGTPVLRSVSFAARAGQVTGLVGPNGAGKSTLLRVMAGVLRPDAGSVRLGAADLTGLPARERARQIAYLPQHEAAHPFTALETVLMARYPHLSRFALEGADDRRIARAAMAAPRPGGSSTASSTGSPAASASGCCWRGRWRSRRASCCSTSRWPDSTSGISSPPWRRCGPRWQEARSRRWWRCTTYGWPAATATG